MKTIPTRTQWRSWALVTKAGYLGAWFGGLGLLLAIALIIISLVKHSTHNDPEMEFEQLLHQVDEEVQKPFEKWLYLTAANILNCDEGSRIATHALALATEIAAFSTSELGSYRLTKAMAKQEYLAMLYSWAAAVEDTCRHTLPDGETRSIDLCRRVLAEYDTVVVMRRALFAGQTQDVNLPRLQAIAQDIENITTWYAGRAACILFLRGHHDYNDAYRLAQLAHDLYPKEPDPWMDRVRSMRVEARPQ
jgi:hypothetical protein